MPGNSFELSVGKSFNLFQQVQFQQVGLIYDSQALVDPATRLVDISRSSVSHVGDKHSAGLLLQNSQQLSVRSDELKVMIDLAKSDSNSFRSMWPNCARC